MRGVLSVLRLLLEGFDGIEDAGVCEAAKRVNWLYCYIISAYLQLHKRFHSGWV